MLLDEAHDHAHRGVCIPDTLCMRSSSLAPRQCIKFGRNVVKSWFHLTSDIQEEALDKRVLRFRLLVAFPLAFGGLAKPTGIDALLEVIDRKKDWNDGAAREQLIKIFDALGGAHELTVSGRRRLSSVLFS